MRLQSPLMLKVQQQACMKVKFTFPGGRHMYMVPTTSVPETDLDGYRALRFKYRAVLQEGLQGLLVSLHEADGSQYVATPAPPVSVPPAVARA